MMSPAANGTMRKLKGCWGYETAGTWYVGGGQGAFIGGAHRIAARIDGKWDLVAGALSSDTERAAASAAELSLAADRSYASYEQIVVAETAREDEECPVEWSMVDVKLCH